MAPSSRSVAGAVVVALALAGVSSHVQAEMYDVVMDDYVPSCPAGTVCDEWSAHSTALWMAGAVPAGAGNACAMPAAAITKKASPQGSFSGPWCFCKGSGNTSTPHTCTHPYSVPEQINLQLASPTVVVVAFVTYETAAPALPPVAELALGSTAPTAITGVSHMYYATWYTPARNYTMHFVKFTALEARQQYTYKVRSGSPNAPWSKEFTFRAPYASGETKVAIYGDMGNDPNNNMGNLRTDCANGAIDAIVHMGDHCYNLGQSNDAHGDAYMNGFQPTLAQCPWLPVIGNHESYLGPGRDRVVPGTEERYLNQTWGIAYGQMPEGGAAPTTVEQPGSKNTATTALGHLLTKGQYYGAASHGSTPSGTSRYNSVDIGLFHIVALDLNPGSTPDGSTLWALWNNTEGGRGPSAQGLWLEQDLKAADANRAAVPWIIVTSHFPLQNTMLEENALTSARHYVGDEGEDSVEGHEFTEHHFAACKADAGECTTVAQLLAEQQALIPIMEQYHVDVYDAGHVHSYEVTWPVLNGSATATNYTDPAGIVYITEGNGGVPGVSKTKNSIKPCTGKCRMKGTGGAYGRFSATDSKALKYEHVENPTGKVSDTWTITRA